MSKKIKLPESLLFSSRIVVGLVFIFSGFVKGIDPLGFTYKLQDYFTAFNLVFLKNIALPLATLLILAEFLVGISLFFKLRIKLGAWGGLIFMIVFTPLTLILALTNPVTDCGCFGDAIVITNWQTFYKNLVIIIFAIIVFIGKKQYRPSYHSITEWSVLLAFSVFMIGINIYGLNHLPLIDFRPYKLGISIYEGMEVPEDAPQDGYKTILIYEKDGVQKEFNEENFPWQDSTWKFVDQNSYLVEEGYKPPLHDFLIVSDYGEEITDKVLSNPEYTLLLFSQNLAKANIKGIQEANNLALYCNENQIPFYGISASGENEINKLRNETELNFGFATMDETAIKTIIRSNPGLVMLKGDVIIGKWAWKDIPDPEVFSGNMLSSQIIGFNRDKNSWRVIGLSISMLLIWAGSQIMIKNKS